MLYRLISASPPDFTHTVVSLKNSGHYGPRLRELGVEVHSVGNLRGWTGINGILTLRRIIVRAHPDVVQTWMYHGDLLGGLAARSAGVRTVVWGIRNSNLDTDKVSFSARAAARICALLSTRIPAAIVCCSEEATRFHKTMGYENGTFVVIANGYDLSCFSPNSEARARLRREWGIAPQGPLLGMVARWDPQKDHNNLLHALAKLRTAGAVFRCVLVGANMAWANPVLAARVRQLGLDDTMVLAGARDDVPAVMNALDLHVLSSVGEAFPNTVAEAMACGTPCVVTDVGDARLIVGETGWVVPRRNPEALARAIAEALSVVAAKGRAALGQRCRARIEEKFSLETMVRAYQGLWIKVRSAEAMS